MNTICIAGRPNVGKSTLFNRLYGRRVAITDATPGVTRDAVRVEHELAGRPIQLVDTGGIGEGEEELSTHVYRRSKQEMAAADVVLLVVDANGITGEDRELVEVLRRTGRPAILVVNKVDNPGREALVGEFYTLGIPHVTPISATHGLGIDLLEETITTLLEEHTVCPPADIVVEDRGVAPVRLAIVGRPNTGKSSLLNRLIGEERSIVSDLAGTTRDVVEARFRHRDTDFLVVDTAGIRRRAKVHENIEYYAVQRALDAIDAAELVVLVVDAPGGLAEQDKKIASRIAERGCGVVVALNKWDLLPDTANQREAITDRIRFLFPVFSHVPIVPISALTGEGIKPLLNRLVHVRGELHRRIETGPLNAALKRWIAETPPPSGRRPYKVRYITQVTTNPVRFLAFVNRKSGFPPFYQRYIMNRIRDEFGFHHIPFFVEIKE